LSFSFCELYGARPAEDGSVGIQLLADLRMVFNELTDKAASADLMQKLTEIEISPWAEWNRGGRSPRSIGRLKGLGCWYQCGVVGNPQYMNMDSLLQVWVAGGSASTRGCPPEIAALGATGGSTQDDRPRPMLRKTTKRVCEGADFSRAL